MKKIISNITIVIFLILILLVTFQYYIININNGKYLKEEQSSERFTLLKSKISTSLWIQNNESSLKIILEEHKTHLIRGEELRFRFLYDRTLISTEYIEVELFIISNALNLSTDFSLYNHSNSRSIIFPTNNITFLGNYSVYWVIFQKDNNIKLGDGNFSFMLTENTDNLGTRYLILLAIIICIIFSVIPVKFILFNTISEDYSYRSFIYRFSQTVVTIIASFFFLSIFFSAFIIMLITPFYESFYEIFNIELYKLGLTFISIIFGMYMGIKLAKKSFRRFPTNKLYKKINYFGYFPYSLIIFFIIYYITFYDLVLRIEAMNDSLYFFPANSLLAFGEILFFLVPINYLGQKFRKSRNLPLLSPNFLKFYFSFLILSFTVPLFVYSYVENTYFLFFEFFTILSYVISVASILFLPKIVPDEYKKYTNIDEPTIEFPIRISCFRLLKYFFPFEITYEVYNLTKDETVVWERETSRNKIDYKQLLRLKIQIFDNQFDFANIDENNIQLFKLRFYLKSISIPFLALDQYCVIEASRKGMIIESLNIFRENGFQIEKKNKKLEKEYPSQIWSHLRIVNPVETIYEFRQYKLILFAEANKLTTYKQIDNFVEFNNNNLQSIIKQKLIFYVYSKIDDEAKYITATSNKKYDFRIILISFAELRGVTLKNQSLSNYLKEKYRYFFQETNPYRTSTGEVTSSIEFFGRIRETELLLDAIEKKRHTGIFGIRKIGKSSLARKLSEDPEVLAIKYNIGENSYDVIIKDLFNCITERFNFENLGFLLKDTDYERIETRLNRLFSNYMNYIKRNDLDLRNFCIILDEIDEMDTEKSIKFWKFLRQLSENNKVITYIVVGNQPKINRQQSLPCYRFFDEFFLPPLTFQEMKDMMITLGNIIDVMWDEKLLEIIHSLTAGHPDYTKGICKIFVEQFQDEKNFNVSHLTSLKRIIETRLIEDRIEGTVGIFGKIPLVPDEKQKRDIQLSVLEIIGKNRIGSIEQIIERISDTFKKERKEIFSLIQRTIGHLFDMNVIETSPDGFYLFKSKIIQYWYTQRLELDD